MERKDDAFIVPQWEHLYLFPRWVAAMWNHSDAGVQLRDRWPLTSSVLIRPLLLGFFHTVIIYCRNRSTTLIGQGIFCLIIQNQHRINKKNHTPPPWSHYISVLAHRMCVLVELLFSYSPSFLSEVEHWLSSGWIHHVLAPFCQTLLTVCIAVKLRLHSSRFRSSIPDLCRGAGGFMLWVGAVSRRG